VHNRISSFGNDCVGGGRIVDIIGGRDARVKSGTLGVLAFGVSRSVDVFDGGN
jgi:hypothetical protein